MKKLFVLLFIALPLIASAQTIKGVVASSKDKSPIEFAPVALLNLPDSSIVAGNSSQSGGLFAFENVKPGNYYLRATYVGYSPTGKAITVKAGEKEIKADSLLMSETSKEIDEVVVTGDRIKGKELVDRTVYSIPAEVSKASPNAYDLLKKVPAISVDYNDNISLNGSNNFIIQVDGKQRDKEFLARLQPSDIESIEVINNPSGKYEGNIDGVINVKLKREARFGVSGNVNVAGRPSKQTSANVAGSLDYAMGNATAYVSGYGFYNNLNSDIENQMQLNIPDSAVNSIGIGTYKFSAAAVNAGVDYFQDKYNTFSFNTSYKPTQNSSDMDQSSDIFLATQKMYNQNFASGSSSLSHEINTSAFYKRQFEKPIQEFSVEATVYNFISGEESELNKQTHLLSNNALMGGAVYRLENTDNNRNSLSLKADYTHPIGMDIKIETGTQLYRQVMDFTTTYSYDTQINKYDYTEFRSSAYAGISVNIDNLGLQTTLRVENSNVDINKNNTDNYFTFLPSANVMYKFNSKHNVKLTYNRRINRPNIGQLNPFEKVGASDDISSGNPFLKPEMRDKFQFTYTLNIKKSYVSPYVYYDIFNKKVDNYTSYGLSNRLNKETYMSLPGNLLSGNEKGVGLNAMILFININFRYFETDFDAYNNGIFQIASRKTTSYSIGGWAFAPLPWKMSWFAFANYGGKSATAQGSMQSPFFYGTGIRKEAGNHTIGMFYLLPLINRLTVMDNTVTTAQFSSRNKASFDSRLFIQLQYSYKFNKGKAAKKVSRQTETESDSKKGGLTGN